MPSLKDDTEPLLKLVDGFFSRSAFLIGGHGQIVDARDVEESNLGLRTGHPSIQKIAEQLAPLWEKFVESHFSVIVRKMDSAGGEYFILGQAPMGGGTTLRCITPDGKNCNLGPGPKPDLAHFLNAVRARVAKRQ